MFSMYFCSRLALLVFIMYLILIIYTLKFMPCSVMHKNKLDHTLYGYIGLFGLK